MNILVACEYSNIVSQAFRDKGHFVISCDLLQCDIPGTDHIIGDVRQVIRQVQFDMMIAFPPCTYLAKCQQMLVNHSTARELLQLSAANFFYRLYKSNISKICIENPAGYMNTHFRKPDQIIHPYQFGDPYQKEICLWLKGLPPLITGPISLGRRHVSNHVNGRMSKEKKSHIKSKFFPEIAHAMALQWS